MIDGNTKVCGIIGDPIGHSLSPKMHNAAFEANNLNFVYAAFNVKKDALRDAVAGLKALGVVGFNVTIPHKVDVISYLDDLDVSVRALTAVNTVVRNGSSLVGFNTDVEGFLSPLRSRGIGLSGTKVTVLGAGGAARACVAGLSMEGCESITVLGRTVSRLRELSQALKGLAGNKMVTRPLTSNTLKETVEASDIVVNATPIGMHPNISDSPVPAELLRTDLLVYDLVYNPIKTTLLKYAESAGASMIQGYEMLVAQGAVAFRLWTQTSPPIEVMEKAALEGLGEHHEG
ncbi:MAG: shikimate dehydrogenase [Thaumarchaeota archaeon]|nr:shikimate dehydrogenase [Nitrososphaerota archaeon]